METGAITPYIDVAQLVLYGFWLFFFGLVLYLRREDRREGYPLEHDDGRIVDPGLMWVPAPKVFRLRHGHGTVSVPNDKRDSSRTFAAAPTARWPGSPSVPTGDPMLDGVGPGSYALRADVPDLTLEGGPKIVPMRVAKEYSIEARDPDPRGMPVVGMDGEIGGTVSDVWVDRSEVVIRYLEVMAAAADGPRSVLLPMNFARVDGARGQVRVRSVKGHHFAMAPARANADQVTMLEEERTVAFYGGGTLYADPSRQEPWL
ncbi:MAG: photosynthetic reaction center subunit H [Gammaproteobacteria bacterium]